MRGGPRLGPSGWLVFAWGTGGVALLLLEAVVRLAPIAAGLLHTELTLVQGGAAVLWAAFMLYAEAWRGFHLRFAPRVVVRALGIAADPRPLRVLLAPFVTMGLLHATRRRLVGTWLLVTGIVVLVWIVGLLPAPWRAIVDLGVILGLGGGLGSLAVHTARAAYGLSPSIPADFPP